MRSSVLLGSRAVIAAFAAALVLAPAALGDDGTPSGGAEVPDAPRIDELRCAPESAVCRRGELLAVLGSGMEGADTVVFLGGRGPRDDRRARPRSADRHGLTVEVPGGARSGRVKVVDSGRGAASSPRPLEVRSSADAVSAPTDRAATTPPVAGVFPIQGSYTFGESRSNKFTGRGGHQGNDVFASCGTPLVAPVTATVTRTAFQERAGNYVVLEADDGRSLAFMHMRDAALVRRGQRVAAGQPIGVVGRTGRAFGCHLHFELWTAPGWYEGGEPVDPRPQLKAWDGTPA